MRDGLRILAVVPARSGSKGIPDKNMQVVGGLSLIARAARVLQDPSLDFIDARVLSTDSERYADEGRRHGLDCPFLRPVQLAHDRSSALDVIKQVWRAVESHRETTFDILLLLEPTCPLRTAEDVLRTVDCLIASRADSAVSVSRVDSKFSPQKLLRMGDDGRLAFFLPDGARVVARQELPAYYYRNGACYALRKRAIFEHDAIFTDHTEAVLIERPLVNIDEPIDLRMAQWMAEGDKS